ncbi:MAG TPA: sigma-70 family RNA polymerase sigma factor [Polyangiaceae bacterium]|nr:sigma-70 family RNA polymerase sigma factor [Polyangiaceae bacterium]
MDSDETLIERARSGDNDALAALVARHAPRVLRFGLKLCKDEETARDVLQETLLTAARGIRGFRRESRFSTWLFAIARSICIKQRTRGSATKEAEPLDESAHFEGGGGLVDTKPPPDETIASLELGQALERAIRELEPAQREVLVLRDVEGLSAREVGQVLSLSEEAVKSRLHRARRALRQRLAPLFEEPPPRPTCPDVFELLSRHLEGEITRETCATMEAHVAACPHCAARCTSLRAVLAACTRAAEPELDPQLRAELVASMRRALSAPAP